MDRVAETLRDWRTGRDCSRRLARLEESQFWSADRLQALQTERLGKLLRHAFENTAFFRARFREAGITPADIREPADLSKLPPLTKSDLRERLSELVATNLGARDVHRSATGGSTGQHTPFYRDHACRGRKLAVEHRFNRWTGWRPGDRVAYYWPALADLAAAPSRLGNLRGALRRRRLLLPAGRLDEAALEAHVRALERFRPRLIRAFPNPLSVLANYLKQKRQDSIRPGAVITVGEPLLESQRALFAEVFGCPVFDVYVSRECGNMAGECEAHQGLHLAAESLIIEVEYKTGERAPGGPGAILVTDLENFGMPFIRYRIEDLGSLAEEPCGCGRGLPLLKMGAGRVSDFVVSPRDGSLISGASLCHHLIAEGPEVGQVQILQDERDHLLIRVTRAGRYGETELEFFRGVIHRLFQGAMRVSFEFVDEIPREKSGKYRLCINQWENAGVYVKQG